MKRFSVEVSQNGWEYTGYFHITCDSIKKDPDNDEVIYADHVKIEFDEEVGDIKPVETA